MRAGGLGVHEGVHSEVDEVEEAAGGPHIALE